MFKKVEAPQIDLFTGLHVVLPERTQKKLDDQKAWWNSFYKHVYCKIDEGHFAVLYCDDNGRPNANIKQLVGMMILKEAFKLTDRQLEDNCGMHLGFITALGIANFDDELPTMMTYYNFRRRLSDYYEQTGEDLLQETFASITVDQLQELGINGSKIRMDSKLIQSNIAKASRLELITGVLRHYLRETPANLVATQSREQLEWQERLKTQTPSNISYNMTDVEKKTALAELGKLIQCLLTTNHNHPQYEVLMRLFEEQYTLTSEKDEKKQDEYPGNGEDKPGVPTTVLKPNKEIESGSLQSPHDLDTAYRKKNGVSINGFHANITETCVAENRINLIVDVQADKANVSEAVFFQPAVQNAQVVLELDAPIEQVSTDGGYDSLENRAWAAENQEETQEETQEVSTVEQSEPLVQATQVEPSKAGNFDWNVGKHKGKKSIYNIVKRKDGSYEIELKSTKEKQVAIWMENSNRYKVVFPGRPVRYFTEAYFQGRLNWQLLEKDRSLEDKNIRANVESTIHQCFFGLGKRNKMRYRGMFKCKMYVICAALATNFKRIWSVFGLFPSFPTHSPIGVLRKIWHLWLLHPLTPYYISTPFTPIFKNHV